MGRTTDRGFELLDRIAEVVDDGNDLLEMTWDLLGTYDDMGACFAALMSYWEHHEVSDEAYGVLTEMARGYVSDRNGRR